MCGELKHIYRETDEDGEITADERVTTPDVEEYNLLHNTLAFFINGIHPVYQQTLNIQIEAETTPRAKAEADLEHYEKIRKEEVAEGKKRKDVHLYVYI